MLFTCFSDLAGMIGEIYHALHPGAYVEFQDAPIEFHYKEDSAKGTAMESWTKRVQDATLEAGKLWDYPTRYKQSLQDAGFIEVTETRYEWPVNDWSEDQNEKERGRLCLQNLLLGLESISMALLTQHTDMSEGEVRSLLGSVADEIKDPTIHAYISA